MAENKVGLIVGVLSPRDVESILLEVENKAIKQRMISIYRHMLLEKISHLILSYPEGFPKDGNKKTQT